MRKIAAIEEDGREGLRSAEMDDFDKRILRLVQQNNQMTHAEIGEAVGLSGSAVRRRLKLLRASGVIAADVSILRLDAGVRFIVSVSFGEESVEACAAFDEQMRAAPEVAQCYHVSGAEDYMVIVHGPSVEWYEAWSKQVFMNNPAVRRYDTRVVWDCKKFSTAVPV